MAALQDSGGGEPTRKRARSVGVVAGRGDAASGSGAVLWEGSSDPFAAPASASRAGPGGAAQAVVDVTVEDADALDCGVCFFPLKAPIFQCGVGHVVCLPCSDKLVATGKCHVCGMATRSYRRCHAMERLVESIHVLCPHAAHGCQERPAYHDLEDHRWACVHAPCHCPGEACSFVGSRATLLDHFGEVHGWPCTNQIRVASDGRFDICLHDGFNFLLADFPTWNEQQGTTVVQCLLLLNVVRQSVGRIISVVHIDPHTTGGSGSSEGPPSKEMQCRLRFSSFRCPYSRPGSELIQYYVMSNFIVACTDLSSGLPNLDGCFQLVVPDSAVGKEGLKVKARIFIM